jgi:hypothetical protein
MPKIKSVELKKIYHFALGSNFEIVRVILPRLNICPYFKIVRVK